MTALSTIPALAEAIKTWFPELDGRVLPVSEAEVTVENMPTLPLVMIALQKLTFGGSMGRSNNPLKMNEDILIQFWLKPERYRLANGAQSPFWSYYDYDAILDKLVIGIEAWTSPRNIRLSLEALDIETDEFAVVITVRVTHATLWCRPDDSELAGNPALHAPKPLNPSVDGTFTPFPLVVDVQQASQDESVAITVGRAVAAASGIGGT